MILEGVLLYHMVVGAMLHGPPVQLREDIVRDNREYRCLLRNVWWESQGEDLLGQMYVAKSTLNRVRGEKHPHSVCTVVYQRKQYSWTHQIPKSKQIVKPQTELEKSTFKQVEFASFISIWADRLGIDFTDNSKYYHSTRVTPKWDYSKLVKTRVVGNHVFYRSK